MKNLRHYLFTLLFLIISLAGCSDSDKGGGGGNGGGSSNGDEVSQYEARKWDGVKRGDVFYEIFVRSFADSDGDGIGDLRGITDKLDYLDNLGISGIWLTPIHPSPSYHGYDVEDYKGINPEFGTLDDFDALITKAHSLDIKVILDMVVNHSSKTHPKFKDACMSTDSEYRDYFVINRTATLEQDINDGKVPMTNKYHKEQWHRMEYGTTDYSYMGWFSDWMPEINYGAVETCENHPAFKWMVDIANFWIERGVDGFRLDAVKHVYQDENSWENPEFWRKYFESAQQKKSDVYMVGEMYAHSSQVAPYYKGLPALFEFEGWERLQYAIINHHAKWFPKDLLDYRAKYAAVRDDYIQATKLSNHDEDRAATVLGSIDKAKIAAAIHLTVSGQPYIYYGEEIGMLGSKRQGDENVREPFLWTTKAQDKYRTTWRSPTFSIDAKVRNVESQKKDNKSLWRVYEKFIELRNTYPALATGKMTLPSGFDVADDSNKNLMIFYRESAGEKLYVIHNVSTRSATYSIPEDVKKPIADFGGVGAVERGGKYTITMPPYTTIIFEM